MASLSHDDLTINLPISQREILKWQGICKHTDDQGPIKVVLTFADDNSLSNYHIDLFMSYEW